MSFDGNGWAAPFLRLPPLVLEPEEFTEVWRCNSGDPHTSCGPSATSHPLQYGCGPVYRYELTQAQFIAWTEDREKARRRYQP